MTPEEVNTKVDMLIEQFNAFKDASSATHKELHEKFNELKTGWATITEKLDNIQKALDDLTSKVEHERYKPVKRWDELVGNIIWGVVGAVLVFLLAKVGL